MSFDGSRKEYLYSIYLKKNPKELCEKIGIMLSENDIMLERKYKNEKGKRRVDISGIDETNRRLFCEIQLSKSDEKHYIQIMQLIDLARHDESTVITWIATGFTSEYIKKLMQLIVSNSKKTIELVFLKLNEEVIKPLMEINQCEQFKQIKMLNRLNDIQEQFTLVNSIKNYNGSKLGSLKYIVLKDTYTYKEKILIKILNRLRQDCEEQGNIYQYKDVSGNCFGMGTRYGGIDFKVTVDRRNRIGIILGFSNVKSKKIYYKLKEKKGEIDDEFCFMLSWNDEYEQVSTFLSLGWFHDKEKMILIFGRIIKQYLYGFDKYLKEAINEVKV